MGMIIAWISELSRELSEGVKREVLRTHLSGVCCFDDPFKGPVDTVEGGRPQDKRDE